MKICYLVHQFYPEYSAGTEKAVFNLAAMNQLNGHNVNIVTYGFAPMSYFDRIDNSNTGFRSDIYKSLPVHSWRFAEYREEMGHSLSCPDMRPVASHLLGKLKPDVLHICHAMRMTEFVHVAIEENIPYIITLTDFYWLCPKINLTTSQGTLCKGPQNGETCKRLCPELAPDYISTRLSMAKKILSYAVALTAPSKFVAEIFHAELGIDVKVIPHGMHSSLVRNERRYGKGDRIVFGFIGSLVPHKGGHFLIDSFKKVCGDQASLVLYGDGPDSQYLRNLHKSAHEDHRIECAGTFSETNLSIVLKQIDILVVPSLCYESFSLALHEALACSVPIICSNIGAMQEALSESGGGFVFSAGNQTELTNLLQSISDDPTCLNLYKEKLDKCFATTIEQEAYNFKSFYEQVSHSIIKKTPKQYNSLHRQEISHGWNLDQINGCTFVPEMLQIELKHTDPVLFLGWAVDLQSEQVPTEIYVKFLLVDTSDEFYVRANRQIRQDVATSLCNNIYIDAGFACEVAGGTLPLGAYRIEILQITGTSILVSKPVVDIVLCY